MLGGREQNFLNQQDRLDQETCGRSHLPPVEAEKLTSAATPASQQTREEIIKIDYMQVI